MFLSVKFIFLIILSSVLCADVISNSNDISGNTGVDLSDLSIDDRFGENDDDEFPMETQSAQCTITAGEVRASALASTSKKLEGVCGQRDLRRSFEALERKLLDEIYTLKLMLTQMAYPNAKIMKNYFNFPPPVYSSYNFNSGSSNSNANATTTTTPKPPSNTEKLRSNTTQHPLDNNQPEIGIYFPTENLEDPIAVAAPIPTTKSTKKPTTKPNDLTLKFPNLRFSNNDTNLPDAVEFTTKASILLLKSLESPKPKLRTKVAGPRDFEVHRFNNTIISNDETQIFTYFWKMENFTDKLEHNVTEITSPIFTISGLHLHCKGILNHLNRDYMYLRIESVSYETILREKTPNIILKSGSMFKEIETKKLFRHKIMILDQGSPVATDLISQEFFNTNSGFMIPMSTIKNSYTKNNSVLVKVIIFL